jgi:hypothetical protein
MAPWTLLAKIAVGGVAVLGAAAALGARSWSRATTETLDRLQAAAARRSPAAAGSQPHRYDPAQVAGLPPPVVRYFSFALAPGQQLVRSARFTQRGTFALARDRWAPFSAVETFTVSPPGFVWDARIRMAPLVVAHVRDSYMAGEGVMHGALAGVLTMVDQRGTPEMAAGALLRYLAEAPWFPTALLPSAGVRWDAVDDSTARATLSDSGTTVSMDVHFAASGEIERITAARHRDVKGTPVLTPWVGHYRDYSRVEGMMVPGESEVGWELPDGWFPYWRGRAVRAELHFE